MDQGYTGQDYEEGHWYSRYLRVHLVTAVFSSDDILSFANPNYTMPTGGDNGMVMEKASEFAHLLDHRYKELSPSPESSSGVFYDGNENTDGHDAITFVSDMGDVHSTDEEDIYKVLDEFYVKTERNSGQRGVKRRQEYAALRINDMGIGNDGGKDQIDSSSPKYSEPSSPSTGSGRDESLPQGWEKHEGTCDLMRSAMEPNDL